MRSPSLHPSNLPQPPPFRGPTPCNDSPTLCVDRPPPQPRPRGHSKRDPQGRETGRRSSTWPFIVPLRGPLRPNRLVAYFLACAFGPTDGIVCYAPARGLKVRRRRLVRSGAAAPKRTCNSGRVGGCVILFRTRYALGLSTSLLGPGDGRDWPRRYSRCSSWQANPQITADQIEQITLSAARDIPGTTRDGAGEIDAVRAVEAAHGRRCHTSAQSFGVGPARKKVPD